MALPQGLNCRNTGGYVTDGADENVCSASSAYPQTSAQGNVFGLEGSGWASADRVTTNDRRLAGICYTLTTGDALRLDLPAPGTYDINFAAGDWGFSNPTQWSLRDDTTLLATLTTGSNTSNSYKDATNTEYTAANWPGSNTKIRATFATTILRIRNEATSGNSVMAHLHVAAAASTLGFGKISSNRKYFLPSEAAIVLAALESKRRLSRRRFFQWLPGAFWRK